MPPDEPQNDDRSPIPLIGEVKSAGVAKPGPFRPRAVNPVVVRPNPGSPVADALMWSVSLALLGAMGYVGWRTVCRGEPVATVLPFMALPVEAVAASAPVQTPAPVAPAAPAVAVAPAAPVAPSPASSLLPDFLMSDPLPPPPASAAASPALTPGWPAPATPGAPEKPKEKDESVTLFGRRMPRTTK